MHKGLTGKKLNKDSKIFVAGHRGLVGSALVRKLEERGYRNLLLRTKSELDLRNQQGTEKFFSEARPDFVFLAAAKVGGIFANSVYKADFIYDNVAIASNVIYASYNYGVQKLLNLGSSCIYPRLAPQPLKEQYLLTGPLESTNEPYAVAKITAIKLCRYFNEQHGTNFISAMPTNLYGHGDNFNLETSHVLPCLIRKFHLAKLLYERRMGEIRQDASKHPLGFGLILDDSSSDAKVVSILKELGIALERVTLWGTGKPLREFLYVDDLADACLFMMENLDYKKTSEFLNVGVGKDISVKDLAELVRSIVGYHEEIAFDPSKPDGTPRKLLDVSRVKSLGWDAKTSLEEGIRKTYEWYVSEGKVTD